MPRTMPIRAHQAPGPFRLAGTCTLQGSPGAGALGTFSGLAYTGAPMRPQGWSRDVIIDLKGLQVPSQHRPVLRQHDHEQIVGHTTAVKAGRDGIRVEGVLSGEPQHVTKVVTPARNGFQWQLSIGADPIRMEHLEAGEEATVNGRKVTGPMVISRETRIGEISFVPLGADGDTSVTVAASKGYTSMKWHLLLKGLMARLRAAARAAKYSDEEIDKMSAKEAKESLKKCMAEEEGDAEASDGEDEDDDDDEEEEKKKKSESRRQAALEVQRQSDVTLACRKYGDPRIEINAGGKKKTVSLAAHAIEQGWTVEKTELEALRSSRPATPVVVPGGHAYSTTTPVLSEPVLEAAVFHAARHQFRLEDDGFYCDRAPDGRIIRRVPDHLQRETQREFKGRYTDEVQQAAHTLFKGRIGLQQMLQVCFRAAGSVASHDFRSEGGVRSVLAEWDAIERNAIRAEGASNLSISNILANVLNKFALQGYLFVEQAWREIAGIRAVNDFKPAKSINLLGDVIYKALGPTGELANASLSDQAFANQAQPFGRILTLPWTHLVNDDLGMLTGAPMKIGQGAGLALNDYFWALWASLVTGTVQGPIPAGTNLNGDDGVSFWRTTSSTAAGKAYNKNKLTGGTTALSSSSLTTAKATFDNQIDPNRNPLGFDGTTPILLHGPSNWRTATELLLAPSLVYGGAAAALQPNVNVWQGLLKPVMSRYIENANYVNSLTAWWILFNPAALPVIEVAFLNGVDTPAVLQASPDYQFDRLGISIRGTMPFGVSQQNFRGGVYVAGA